MASRWITCSQAASILDIDPATVRRWLKLRLAGKPSRLRYVRRCGNTYQASKKEIRSLARICLAANVARKGL